MKNLTEWVIRFFEKNRIKDTQKFNVHCYDSEQKLSSMFDLTAMGYNCTLENNQNSLIVTRK